MKRIEEIFAPATIETIEELMEFLRNEITKRGGDLSTVEMIDTEKAIPNVQFSGEWPGWTFKFQFEKDSK